MQGQGGVVAGRRRDRQRRRRRFRSRKTAWRKPTRSCARRKRKFRRRKPAYDKAQADYRARQLAGEHRRRRARSSSTRSRAERGCRGATARRAKIKSTSRRPTVAAAQGASPPRRPASLRRTGALTTAQGKLAQASDPSQVEAAAAQLDLAKQDLSYTQIYSSIDGYIGEKSAEVGQTIGAGMTLMTIDPAQDLHHREL